MLRRANAFEAARGLLRKWRRCVGSVGGVGGGVVAAAVAAVSVVATVLVTAAVVAAAVVTALARASLSDGDSSVALPFSYLIPIERSERKAVGRRRRQQHQGRREAHDDNVVPGVVAQSQGGEGW